MFSFWRSFRMKLMVLWCTEGVRSTLKTWIGVLHLFKFYKTGKAMLLNFFLKLSLKDTRITINLEIHLFHFSTFRQSLVANLPNLRYIKQLLFLFPLIAGPSNQVLRLEILNHFVLPPLDSPVQYLQHLNPQESASSHLSETGALHLLQVWKCCYLRLKMSLKKYYLTSTAMLSVWLGTVTCTQAMKKASFCSKCTLWKMIGNLSSTHCRKAITFYLTSLRYYFLFYY